MNYIVRNYEFDTDNNKAFEIYSDSTCEHLEYTCNYHDMLEIMQENIYLMANDGLISYREGWKMRDDISCITNTLNYLNNTELL